MSKLRLPPMRALPAVLGVVGVGLGLGGWVLQASATSDLQRTLEVQKLEVPDEGGAPPSLEQYRDVVTTIEDSIAIRQNIDSLLGGIEEQVSALVSAQGDSRQVVAEALASLTSIAGKLDSSVTSARQSTDRLDALGARLRRSLVLARSIADELEELDESMGPSTGGGP